MIKISQLPVYGNYNFSTIEGGLRHSCGLLQNGSALCWGDNPNGQLGDNTTIDKNIPILIYGNHNFSTIFAGGIGFSCGLLQNGSVLCWGQNNNGQLGIGSFEEKHIPIPIYGNHNFSMIEVALVSSCGLLQNGSALCWGLNAQGQIGDNTSTKREFPTPVYGNYNFSLIESGQRHSCGLLQNGSAMCWGQNLYGQIGDGTKVNKFFPVFIKINEKFNSIDLSSFSTFGVLTDGRIISIGRNDHGQQAFSNFDSTIPTKGIYKGKLVGKNINSFEIGSTFEGNLKLQVNNGFEDLELDNGYNHIILNYNGTTAKVYLNSELSETFNPPGFSLSTELKDLIIGNSIFGQIDDLLMWNRSLTDDEIEFIYKSNLEKLNETSWSFTTSFSDLVETTYNYGVYVSDSFGWISSLRNLIVNFPDVSIPSSSGGGLSITYDLNKLEKGISGHYPKNYVINFNGDFVKVNNISEDKVELNVSGIIVEIVFENMTKIDSDDDGFYDLEISLGGKNSIYAELSIKSIYEEMPAVSEEAVVENSVGEVVVDEVIGFFGRIWDWFVGLFRK